MSPKIYKLAVLFLFLIVVSCTDEGGLENAPPAYEVNILTLGDSRVQGNRPNHESYRFELWKSFIQNNWTVDFLGPNIDTSEYPLVDGLNFDSEHGGVGGYTTKNVLSSLEETLASVEMPDVILLGIGGNDLVRNIANEDAIQNIHGIIDILQDYNPDITIFIEQIAPAVSEIYDEENILIFNSFNDAILTVSGERTTEDSQVIAVDMASDWYDILLADQVHYNSLGAKVVADKYYNAVNLHLER
ncbi:GDSL-type esterase/lipase family protein [uncultured Dokdonia sp.]|uniref:SGNH/GDSL hydrolase family protein n=1 Tax=uncultured Dokdonia sp. TaxID=575653 RepID=UPI002633C6CF|nr:GDSL-type esterase/lipase family protein [uncultured Dokdonia sp.]